MSLLLLVLSKIPERETELREGVPFARGHAAGKGQSWAWNEVSVTLLPVPSSRLLTARRDVGLGQPELLAAWLGVSWARPLCAHPQRLRLDVEAEAANGTSRG